MTRDTIVIVSTANRPGFLATNLASIARQTAADRIAEVRVMENGGDRRSEAVCRDFAGKLPINYIYRDPPLTVIDHAKVIIQAEFAAPYIAILHDDDWWAPEHLGASLRALEENQAAACYSAHFYMSGEAAPTQWHDSLMFWTASHYQPLTQDWVMDMTGALVANLGGTPGHYSTVVAKSEAFRGCADTLYQENPFDTDRMLCVWLTRFGRIVYRPVPTAFIRVHPSQDNLSYTDAKRNEHHMRTTLWMFKVAKENGIDLIDEFRRRLEACPEPHRYLVFIQYTKPFLIAALGKHPRCPKILMDFWLQLQNRNRGEARAA
ncbi:MAG TPA: glycosyltransferase family A protein [Opitutaceae bacterium]|jgi:glycosyltransferase involved in cell wall biosynthesis